MSIADDLGTYVGSLSAKEALKALGDHTPGEWVMELTDPNGNRVWQKQGWSWYTVTDNYSGIFVCSSRPEKSAGNPAMFVDALVLHFVNDRILGECEQWLNGLVITFGFGTYEGHTLRMLAHHSILHETPSGDFAPGLGSFEVDSWDDGEEDEVQPE
jgi:hypothetical protein